MRPPAAGAPTSSGKRAKSNPELLYSFEGLNHRASRLAENGNAFSGEPADQALCVGNGYIVESVNSAIRVYNEADGSPASPTLSLNQLYGFAPAINRTTGVFGPFTFDVACHYDPHSDRWFHLAVDLDQHPTTGAFTGRNYLDLAVSQSGDPRGAWNVYRIPAINDGSEGTPDHNCAGGPCFGDFPHLGVDRNGVYITTNEFPLFGDGFNGAQIYAMSKTALASGASTLDIFLFDTSQPANDDPNGVLGFTLWPALHAGTQFSDSQNGTNYFVSSYGPLFGGGDEMVTWALSNTASLNTAAPALKLTSTVNNLSTLYAIPRNSVQKPGTLPYRDLFAPGFPLGTIDTSDARVLDARYANGKLWAVLNTAAAVNGKQVAGVTWAILSPKVNSKGVSATRIADGILALEDESLAYPTIGVTEAGRGVIGFTRVGPNLHPSTGYASIDAVAGVGAVHMIEEGDAPQDGFTEYTSRPRWGDYGAAAVVGQYVYVANQYIEQDSCTAAQLLATNCNFTRTSLANWSTRVAKLKP